MNDLIILLHVKYLSKYLSRSLNKQSQRVLKKSRIWGSFWAPFDLSTNEMINVSYFVGNRIGERISLYLCSLLLWERIGERIYYFCFELICWDCWSCNQRVDLGLFGFWWKWKFETAMRNIIILMGRNIIILNLKMSTSNGCGENSTIFGEFRWF